MMTMLAKPIVEKGWRMENVTARRIGRPMASSRKEVLLAADGLLKEGGESALSFRRLADKLGLSAPSIYTYFSSKQELLLALVESTLTIGKLANDKQNAFDALSSALNQLRQNLLKKQHLMFLFGKVVPANCMLGLLMQLAEIIECEGVDHGYAVRYGQSLIWTTLGFVIFEAGSKQEDILALFSDGAIELEQLLPHLDLQNHDRLWKETLERNLLFLKTL